MESYKIVNLKNIDRVDYFQYFMSVGTTIEFTVKIDVTTAIKKCKKESVSFQAYMLFKIYKTMNTIKNFKYDILDGKLIEWEKLVPTFSYFNKDSKLFFTLYADMADDYLDFDKQYKETIEKYANSNAIVPQGVLPPNVFNVSCIPWMHFEHFSSNFQAKENQIVKMITIGKYKEINERFMMPFTIQVSHAIVDGYHISMFFEKLQEELDLV